MVIELLVFFAFFLAFYAFALSRIARNWLRYRRRTRWLERTISSLEGRRVETAAAALGLPSEVIDGADGRALWVWKAPPAPAAPGLVILSLDVNASGVVTGGAWRSR